MEERTEWRESDKKRKEADLFVLLRPAKSLQNVRASAEKLEHIEPSEKKKVAADKAVGKYAKAVCPKCQIVRMERV